MQVDVRKTCEGSAFVAKMFAMIINSAKSHRMLTAMQHVTCNCDFHMCIPNLVMLELLAWTPDAQWATGQSSMQGAAGGSQCRHHSRSDASW